MESERWRCVVESARWAPSPHNTQPWRVRVLDEERAELLCEADRLLPVEDPDAFFMQVGFGIFLEALDVAAARDGMAVAVTNLAGDLSKGGPRRHVADLRLVPRSAAAHGAVHDAALLERRRTSRRVYDGRVLAGDAKKACQAIAEQSGSGLVWSDDASLIHWLLELNRDTMFLDMQDDATRNEVAAWVRGNGRQARASRDGLWSRCLGFPGWLLTLFFRRPATLRLPLVHAAVRRRYLRSTRGARTVGWLSSPVGTPEERILAGRMLMRVWLELAQRDAVLHPFGSIITNPTANACLQERLGTDGGPRRLWLVFRAGYSAVPPRSLRRTASEVLT